MLSSPPSSSLDRAADRPTQSSYAGTARKPELLSGILTISGIGTFFKRRGKLIALLSIVLFMIGCGVLAILPARYAATALVLIDPREQRVTADPDVLAGIGQDAAALQSVIEIAKSDGFLLPLIKKLNVQNDEDISGSETDVSRILDRFRSRLDISRRGLTYIVAMTFTSTSASKAAFYANAVAEAFVAGQTQVRADATEEAADWLKSRLKTLSDELQKSEDAVAAFKLDHQIVNAGRDSTTRQLRVTELTQQVSAARLRLEEAKNRYEQAQRDIKANVDSTFRSDLLSTLRVQRSQLNDQIAQKRAVFGDRHPDLMISTSQLSELDRQIEIERKRSIATAKSEVETASNQQKSLEAQQRSLEAEMLKDGQAGVKLQELQRNADASRNIYEQFLSRYKTTSEQRLFQATQTKMVSPAQAPTRTNRPSLALLLAAIAIASVMSSTAGVALLAPASAVTYEQVETKAAPVVVDHVDTSKPAIAADRSIAKPALTSHVTPVWGRIPHLTALGPTRTVWQRPGDVEAELQTHLRGLVDAIIANPRKRAMVVLVASIDRGVGKSIVATSLFRSLSERKLKALLFRVVDKGSAMADLPTGDTSAVFSGDFATAFAVLSGGKETAGASSRGITDSYDVIIVDAPSVAEFGRVTSLGAVADYTVVLTREGAPEAVVYHQALESFGSFNNSLLGLVVNQKTASLALARSV